MSRKGESKIYTVGRRELMKCGQYAEIIEYIDGQHIRVRFDDGYTCIAWPEQFRRGEIKNKSLKFKYDVGDTSLATNGHLMTIIERKDKSHIKIRFDDGFEKWCNTAAFVAGNVSHPKFPVQKGNSKYIGRIVEKDGHVAECVAIEDGKLIVQFDHKEKRSMVISQFNKGFLFPHEDRGELISRMRKKTCEKFIGEKRLNGAGLEMVLVEYQDANHCTVEFTETGYRVVTRRQQFLDGKVEDQKALANQYLSLRKMQRCGLWAQVVEYKPARRAAKNPQPAEYVIEFEDGYRVVNEGMHDFSHGTLKNPNRPLTPGSVINGVSIIKKRFNLGTEPQLYCRCQSCGWEDIASFDEIWAHKCDFEEVV